MSSTRDHGRRCFLRDGSCAAVGALLSAGGFLARRRSRSAIAESPVASPTTNPPSNPLAWDRVNLVVSLTALQRELRQSLVANVSSPVALECLFGMTTVIGWLRSGDDVTLLGDREVARPPLSLDSLVVALRSAFQVSGMYRIAPGCSIDPWHDQTDPWAIQEVRVFGMPADCGMASRFVAVDYEMKQAAAGVMVIDPDVPSVPDLARRSLKLCAESVPEVSETAGAVTHRLWFCPRYPTGPRFRREDDCLLIEKPVGVQLLTEQEFLDKSARRLSAGPAEAEARRFAERASALLASAQRPEYAVLQNDFRLVEAGKLLRMMQDARLLDYLLHEYPLATARVPRYVTGISRDERLEVVCDGAALERESHGRRLVEARTRTQKHRYHFKGGVTCEADTPDDAWIALASTDVESLRRRIIAARPSDRAVSWSLGTAIVGARSRLDQLQAGLSNSC